MPQIDSSACGFCFFCILRLCFLFFFFFQAEDGIRDLTVTGVQTCALPISHAASRHRGADALADHRDHENQQRLHPEVWAADELYVRAQAAERKEERQQRSEERRVGKECRSRWSPYQ